jgi:subtilase family serine protease
MKRHSIPTGRVFGLISGALFAATAMAQQQGPPDFSHAAAQAQVNHVPVCPGPAAAGTARCHARVVTDDKGQPLATSGPTGLGPVDLRGAYNVPYSGPAQSFGPIIAIVDAYGYPNAEADLAVYRSQFNLPACTTANGCFRKVDQNGGTNYPRTDTGWSQEAALDLDMASAMCPNCKIILVQASSSSLANLATAVNTAATKLNAHVISNSYGGGETGSATYEGAYNHPGIAITVSSGDSGYGVQFPASSPHVTAVGGTSLKRASTTTRGWTETVWSGAGSGCSTTYAKPSWQTDNGCSKRTVADVSAVADPNTGVSVYGPVNRASSGWMVFGGTSVSAPLIGGVYAVNGGNVNYGKDPYNNTGSLNDVTSGSNGSCGGSYLCTAVVGYDGPTGLGTPNGTAAF